MGTGFNGRKLLVVGGLFDGQGRPACVDAASGDGAGFPRRPRLDRAEEAYRRMKSGEAKFRMVLTMDRAGGPLPILESSGVPAAPGKGVIVSPYNL
ncbi:hypothetical protein JL37_02375 [Achromobacter sp. RTa]|nr:hypothetical protein JL37_02375 [Achromobacter sp. RTa]